MVAYIHDISYVRWSRWSL